MRRLGGSGTRRIPVPFAAALAAGLLAVGGAAGCAVQPGGAFPESPGQTSGAGTPIGRSTHPRSGQLSYRLGQIHRDGDRLRVDFQLTNSTHRDFLVLGLRAVAYGTGGETRTSQVAVGALRDGRTQSLSAHFPDVPFQVEDVGLELIYSSP